MIPATGTFKFEYQFDASSPKIIMELHPEMCLGEVLDAFEGFLKGAGYHLEGEHIDLIPEGAIVDEIIDDGGQEIDPELN